MSETKSDKLHGPQGPRMRALVVSSPTRRRIWLFAVLIVSSALFVLMLIYDHHAPVKCQLPSGEAILVKAIGNNTAENICLYSHNGVVVIRLLDLGIAILSIVVMTVFLARYLEHEEGS